MNPSTLNVRIVEEYNMCKEECAAIIDTFPTKDRFRLSAGNEGLYMLELDI